MDIIEESVNKILIVEIPLNGIKNIQSFLGLDIKYIYGRFYNLSKLFPSLATPYIIQIYNTFEGSADNLENLDFLFGDILIYRPPLRGAGKWKILNHIPLYENDFVTPDFKLLSNYKLLHGKDSKNYYLRNFSKYEETSYDKIKHLEVGYLYPIDLMKYRTFIEIFKLKYESKRIKQEEWLEISHNVASNMDFFTNIDVKELNWQLTEHINHYTNELIYSKIPKEIRGKAIE